MILIHQLYTNQTCSTLFLHLLHVLASTDRFSRYLVNKGVGNKSGCYEQGTRSAVEKPQNE